MIETGKLLQQRYRVDKQIGQGGMGAVYVATDERFGSTVAIKETLCMDDNYRKAIEREERCHRCQTDSIRKNRIDLDPVFIFAIFFPSSNPFDLDICLHQCLDGKRGFYKLEMEPYPIVITDLAIADNRKT